MNEVFAACVWAAVPWLTAQTSTPIPPGTPITITVTPLTAAASPVSFTLGPRQASVNPARKGFTHTGGGNIDVAQPSPDTVVITMTGVAVAGPHPFKDSAAALCFDLAQSFDISFDSPKVKKAKLIMAGRVIGLLRSDCNGGGSVYFDNACCSVDAGGASLLTICVPATSVCQGQNRSLNAHEGPQSVPVLPGSYALHQTLTIGARHPRGLCPTAKAVSAEFAPEPALDPLWISYWEPFHGASKKDFGFQITLKVVDDTSTADAAKK